jgi:S1-C subfamily serine protease
MKLKIIIGFTIFLSTWSFSQSFQIDSSRFFKTKEGCKVYCLYYDEEFSYSWKGSCKNGFAHQYGELTIQRPNSDELECSIKGDFVNGIPMGPCVIITNNGTKIEVPLVDGKIWGVGSYTMQNGEKYKGNMVNFSAHGDGLLIYPDGDEFTGSLIDNELWNGKIISLNHDTTYIHKGEKVKKPIKLKAFAPELNKEITEFFDADWKRCEQVKASYYRKITYQAEHLAIGAVRDYYINGALFREMNLQYVDCRDIEMDRLGFGPYKKFYQNGTLRSKCHVNQNGDFEGRFIAYHDNGNFKQIGNYDINGNEDGNWAFFDEQGKLIRYDIYENGEIQGNKYYTIDAKGLWQSEEIYNYEDFENDEDFWIDYSIIGAKKYPNQYLFNYELIIPVLDGPRFLRTLPLTADKTGDFVISMQANALRKQIKKGGIFGLIFDYRAEDDFYSMVINHKDEVKILEHKSGSITEKFSAVIEKQYKKIKEGKEFYDFTVAFGSEKILFWLNDQLITEYKKNNSLGDKYGVIASGNVKFRLSELSTLEIFDEETSNDFSDFVQKKVVNYNPSEYDGNGSGFFISRQGHIVTNYHVVEETSALFTKLNINGQIEKLPLRIVSKDKLNDLVILKVDKAGFDLGKDIPYGFEYNTLDVGEEVFTLGYPMVDVMGEELKFTDGKISAKSGIDGDITTYQITTPIQSGNSGGPLFKEESGNIVGIVNATLNRKEFNGENVNYAIKSNLLKTLIESLSEPIKVNTVNAVKEMKLSDRIILYREFMPIIYFKE